MGAAWERHALFESALRVNAVRLNLTQKNTCLRRSMGDFTVTKILLLPLVVVVVVVVVVGAAIVATANGLMDLYPVAVSYNARQESAVQYSTIQYNNTHHTE